MVEADKTTGDKRYVRVKLCRLTRYPSNVRFRFLLPENCHSASGPIEPKDECPVFGRAVAERTVANPPKAA
jgi:hypothetical protein